MSKNDNQNWLLTNASMSGESGRYLDGCTRSEEKREAKRSIDWTEPVKGYIDKKKK